MRRGSWVIRLEGSGPIYNGSSNDADLLASDMVTALVRAGHQVTHAEVQTEGNLLFERQAVVDDTRKTVDLADDGA